MATGIKGTSSMHLHRDLGVTQKTWTNGRYRHADGASAMMVVAPASLTTKPYPNQAS